MTVFRMWAALGAVFAFTLALFGAGPAKAEGQCPPGYFQTGGRDYIACAPMGPVSGGQQGPGDDEPSPYIPPPMEIQPSYMAAATHIDTSAFWVTRGARTAAAANKRALAGCTAVMGEGCEVAETVYGFGPLGVAIDAMGLRWIKSGGNMPTNYLYDNIEVRFRDLAALCQKKSFGCEFEEWITQGLLPREDDPNVDYSFDIFPDGPVARHHWAFVARPEKTPAAIWQNKAWLISGKRNSEEASKEVLARCRADSGGPCAIEGFVANGVLVHFANSRGTRAWTNAVPGHAMKIAKARAKAKGKAKKAKAVIDGASVEIRVVQSCPPSVAPCRVIAQYDAVTPRLEVIDEAQ
jgi:hypothetical protein